MNNDFIIEKVTPAIARKIMGAMAGSQTYVDPKIVALADQDRFQSSELSREENRLAQFILDHDYRCVIPTLDVPSTSTVMNTLAFLLRDQRAVFMDRFIEWKERDFRYTTLKAGSRSQYHATACSGISAFNPELVIEYRDSIWVAPMIDSNYPWLARMIPRLIITGHYAFQQSLFGASIYDNNAVSAAVYLTPAYASIPPKLLITMKPTSLAKLGIYSRFIEEKTPK